MRMIKVLCVFIEKDAETVELSKMMISTIKISEEQEQMVSHSKTRLERRRTLLRKKLEIYSPSLSLWIWI